MERYKTLGATTLAEALDASETGVDVVSAAGLRDSYASGDTYRVRVDNEIMVVTAEATNTLTVTRGVEGTTAATHSNGTAITQVVTSAALTQLKLDANLAGISGNNSNVVLGADFAITGLTTVYQDSGLAVTLPSAGTYLLMSAIAVALAYSAGSFISIQAKLRNTTDSTDVTAQPPLISYNNAGTLAEVLNVGPLFEIVTVAASKVIKLYVNRQFDGTSADSRILIGSTLAFVKIA
jgi:hypothetical protein